MIVFHKSRPRCPFRVYLLEFGGHGEHVGSLGPRPCSMQEALSLEPQRELPTRMTVDS